MGAVFENEPDIASEIVSHAQRRAASVADPLRLTIVVEIGQILVAVDQRYRLLGLGVVDRRHDSVLLAICGHDEYGAWKGAHNRLQRARRQRARSVA